MAILKQTETFLKRFGSIRPTSGGKGQRKKMGEIKSIRLLESTTNVRLTFSLEDFLGITQSERAQILFSQHITKET